MTQSKVGVTLDGVCTWQLVRGDTVEQEGTQHNLLLDSGLDNIGVYGLINPYKYACVGTGTSEPVVTQTALDSEVARTLTRPSGYSDNPTYQSPGVYTLELVREFSEASIANRNLTEWGFSPVSQGGVGVRERFRDDDGNPVTLTPDGSQKLRLTYEVSVTLSPASPQAFSFDVTGAGATTSAGSDTLSGQYRLMSLLTTGASDFNLVNQILLGATQHLYAGDYNGGTLPAYNGRSENDRYDVPFDTEPYQAGSFSRAVGSATASAATFVGTISEFTVRRSSNDWQVGYIAVLDTEHVITKDDLHTLTIEGPIISWSRA